MPSVEQYVDMGYAGIVVLESETHEKRSGMQEEVTRERIVCRDRQGKHHELVFVWVDHPLKPVSNRIDERRPITGEEYARLAAQHGVRDSERFYREREARREAARNAQAEVERLTPLCPNCGSKMVVKTNRQKRNRFWGCPTYGWAGCRGTRDLPAGLAVRLDRLNAVIAGAR